MRAMDSLQNCNAGAWGQTMTEQQRDTMLTEVRDGLGRVEARTAKLLTVDEWSVFMRAVFETMVSEPRIQRGLEAVKQMRRSAAPCSAATAAA